MVLFSGYPHDPRPRRAIDALLGEGMTVELICLADEGMPKHESRDLLDVRRVSITRERGGKFSYAYRYSAFILASSLILAWRSLRRRYDLVYVHNMPDVLVVSALIPKTLGAKVILDQHDPMPELATTIFGMDEGSLAVRVIQTAGKMEPCTGGLSDHGQRCMQKTIRRAKLSSREDWRRDECSGRGDISSSGRDAHTTPETS